MNKKLKKLLLVCLLSLQATQTVAISSILAGTLTGFMGAVGALAVCRAQDERTLDVFYRVACCSNATILWGQFVYSFTSAKRMEKAYKILGKEASFSAIFDQKCETIEEVILYLNNRFAYDKYPLVHSLEVLALHKTDINKGLQLIYQVRYDASDNITTSTCDRMKKQFKEFEVFIDKLVVFIKNSPEYKEQFKMYQDEMNSRVQPVFIPAIVLN